MTTTSTHRVLLAIPDARKAALTSWWVANIDPNGVATFSSGLSPTGSAPATYWWCSAALTVPELKKLAQRLIVLANAQGAGITLPADWDTRTNPQRRTWLLGQRAAIRTATGIWLVPDDNTGAWSRADDALEALGLMRIEAVMA